MTETSNTKANELERVMWEKGKYWVIDFVKPNGRTQLNDNTLEEVREEYNNQDIHIYTYAEYQREIEKLEKLDYLDPPAEIIDEERYEDQLGVLPPCRWHAYSGVQFFHISERITGNIVSWYAKCGNEFKHFYGQANMSDEDLLSKFKGE